MESKYDKMRKKAREDFKVSMMIIDIKERQDKKTMIELEEFLTQVYDRAMDSYNKEANKPDEEFDAVKVDCLVKQASTFKMFLKLVSELKKEVFNPDEEDA